MSYLPIGLTKEMLIAIKEQIREERRKAMMPSRTNTWLSAESKQELARLYQERLLSINRMAKEFNIHRNTLRNIMIDLGVFESRRKYNLEKRIAVCVHLSPQVMEEIERTGATPSAYINAMLNERFSKGTQVE